MQILAYTGNDDAKKFVLDKEVTTENVKVAAAYISLSISHRLTVLPAKKTVTFLPVILERWRKTNL